jgi:hypothetical protein
LKGVDYENGNRAHGSRDDVQRDHIPQRLACIRLIRIDWQKPAHLLSSFCGCAVAAYPLLGGCALTLRLPFASEKQRVILSPASGIKLQTPSVWLRQVDRAAHRGTGNHNYALRPLPFSKRQSGAPRHHPRRVPPRGPRGS